MSPHHPFILLLLKSFNGIAIDFITKHLWLAVILWTVPRELHDAAYRCCQMIHCKKNESADIGVPTHDEAHFFFSHNDTALNTEKQKPKKKKKIEV